jgi:hypothetical protein
MAIHRRHRVPCLCALLLFLAGCATFDQLARTPGQPPLSQRVAEAGGAEVSIGMN